MSAEIERLRLVIQSTDAARAAGHAADAQQILRDALEGAKGAVRSIHFQRVSGSPKRFERPSQEVNSDRRLIGAEHNEARKGLPM